MSTGGLRGRPWDRRFALGLLALVAVTLLSAVLGEGIRTPTGGPSLSGAYGRFVTLPLASFVYVPVFAFCSAGALRPVGSVGWLTRSSRLGVLGSCVGRLLVRAVLSSAVLEGCGLALVCAVGPASYHPGDVFVFGLLGFVLQALFFLVVGMVLLAVRLLSGSGAYAALAALAYGALDYALTMTPAYTVPAFWTGWFLTFVSGEDGYVGEAVSAARLAALLLVLGLVSVSLVRKRDFVSGGGGPREM